MKKLLCALLLAFSCFFVTAGQSDTVRFELKGPVIREQIRLSFMYRSCGMLPFMMQDSLDFVMVLSPENILQECASKGKVVQNLNGIFTEVPYVAFEIKDGVTEALNPIHILVAYDANMKTLLTFYFVTRDNLVDTIVIE